MKHRKDAGFSLAALIFIATAVSILLSAAYPAYQLQAKREREEELIFRGEEYARAVQKFQRKFGVYPPSIDALIQTNGLRFLRRAYKDPITGEDFRVIQIGPDGTLIGSTLAQQRINNTPLFGGQLQMFPGQTPGAAQPPGAARSPGAAQPPGASQPAAGTAPSTSGTPQANPAQRPQAAAPPSFSLGPRPQQPGSQPQPGSQLPQAGQGIQPLQTQQGGLTQPSGGTYGSAGVVGVGANSMEASIKVYNQRQKYNEWEFIAIMTPNGIPAPGAGAPAGVGANQPPGTPPVPGGPPLPNGSPFSGSQLPGTQFPGNPAQPGTSPFQGTPPPGGTNPFQNPSQQPFKRP
jgi:type II secretory pathway pseudopilin PulG